jgi:two-component system, cell cycle sensor histidine kinase and response regulator CckA
VDRLKLFSPRCSSAAQSTPPADLIIDEATRFQATWGPSIQLRVAVPNDLPAVAADAGALVQILAAPLTNAQEAIRTAGSVTLTARVIELTTTDCWELLGDPSPGTHVLLRIMDTGSGFSPEARRRALTEPFYSSKPRKRGLGLLSVFSLLRGCGGGMRLEHPDVGGAEVQVYLPLACESEMKSDRTKNGNQQAKVLVVENDPAVRRLISTALSHAGFEVHIAADGWQAAEVFQRAQQPFALIITAAVLPRMNGFELAQHLVGQDSGVKVLIATGPADLKPESPSLRPFGTLSKPFHPEDLIRAVRQAIARPSTSK